MPFIFSAPISITFTCLHSVFSKNDLYFAF
jgi:hypothetical protein